MADGAEMYRVWAPAGGVWSDWVAPALFAQIAPVEASGAGGDPGWFPGGLPARTAVVLDLPGAKSFRYGVELAETRGYRPVPVINASPGPWDASVVDMRELVGALYEATEKLEALRLEDDAPPVFLLDDARLHGTRPAEEGTFDNRWMVFPQDFPSAAFLRKQGVEDVLLVQEVRGQPQEDLAHVLRRWQEAGVRIRGRDGAVMEVKRPSGYRAAWYRAMAILGLRRNRAGGFGSFVPQSWSAG